MASWLALLLLAGSGPAFGAERQSLPGHVPAATKQLQPIGRLAATNELHLALGLPSRDQPGLDAFLQALQDPASPSYHQYLTPDQFTERFGPTAAAYQAVVDYATAQHLTVVQKYHNRLVLSVAGKVADIEQALQVKMLTYPHPTEARTFYAPDVEPSPVLSTRLAHISGLDNYTLPHPKHHRSAGRQAKATPHGSGPSGQLWGNDYRDAYVPGTTLTGAGQSMGLLEFETYYASDLTNYVTSALHLPASRTPAVTIVPIDDSDGSVSQSESGDNGEECSLDLEVSFALAPGVSNIVIFAGGAYALFDEIFATMVEPAYTNILQFSCSWGGGTAADPLSETLFQQMQAQGQSFYNATGDNGACPPGTVELPGDSPSITQVGGSSLTVGPARAYAWVSETAWDDNSGPAVAVTDCSASTGGFSAYYPIPYWQTNVSYINSTGTNHASRNWRNFPDVSANAEENNEIIADQGQEEVWGGTSFAAPMWCGFTALLNQQQKLLNPGTGKPVGFLNPALYALAQQPNAYTTYFHDVSSGNNLNSSSPTNFFCTPGYDLVCGLGTPMGTNLINALVTQPDSLAITPIAGFQASGFVGGPINGAPQAFTLTNTGAKALSWSLTSTSAWLAVSVSSGTLAAGNQTNVTVSLTAAANNLAMGAYAASVVFSNQTSHVVQPRPFSLQVLSYLAVSPTTGFVASGPVGGRFNLTTQNFTLTNLRAAALNWGLLNTSLWLTASPAAGSLAGGALANCSLALSSAAYALPAGVYAASVLVTNQGGTTAALPFTLQVGQSIVQNGGFETADFTGWTLVGDINDGGAPSNPVNAVENSSFTSASGVSYVHSGNYGAVLGEYGVLATLSQSVATVPGQSYLLSLWLSLPTSDPTASFDVNWSPDGIAYNTLYGITNPPAFSWTNLTFVVTASGPSSTIQFAAENDQDYFGLDDVSLTPIPKPSFAELARGTNQLALTWYALPGVAYVVQYKTNLLQANWISLSTNNAAASTASFTNTLGTDPGRFYRVRQLP